MSNLSLHDAMFLKKHFLHLSNLKKLRDGIVKPESPKGERFLDVLQGKILPETQWERAFLHWTEINEPDLNWYILKKLDESENLTKKRNKRNKTKKIHTKSKNKIKLSTNAYNCSVCNDVIPLERIKLEPTTSMCFECATKNPTNNKDRYIKDEFGSRSDYKRDRGGWRKNNI
mgnify:CR=1 FL=1